eukprot:scaffold559_cov358-Prasinococcus_capsulatus_cf.AAC.6
MNAGAEAYVEADRRVARRFLAETVLLNQEKPILKICGMRKACAMEKAGAWRPLEEKSAGMRSPLEVTEGMEEERREKTRRAQVRRSTAGVTKARRHPRESAAAASRLPATPPAGHGAHPSLREGGAQRLEAARVDPSLQQPAQAPRENQHARRRGGREDGAARRVAQQRQADGETLSENVAQPPSREGAACVHDQKGRVDAAQGSRGQAQLVLQARLRHAHRLARDVHRDVCHPRNHEHSLPGPGTQGVHTAGIQSGRGRGRAVCAPRVDGHRVGRRGATAHRVATVAATERPSGERLGRLGAQLLEHRRRAATTAGCGLGDPVLHRSAYVSMPPSIRETPARRRVQTAVVEYTSEGALWREG